MLEYWRRVCLGQTRRGLVSPLWAVIAASFLLHSIASLPVHHYHNGVPHTHDFGAYSHDHDALPLHLHEGHSHAHGRFGTHAHGAGRVHGTVPGTCPDALRNGGERPGKSQEEHGGGQAAAPGSYFCSQSAPGLPVDATTASPPFAVSRVACAERVTFTQFRVCLSYDNRAPPAFL